MCQLENVVQFRYFRMSIKTQNYSMKKILKKERNFFQYLLQFDWEFCFIVFVLVFFLNAAYNCSITEQYQTFPYYIVATTFTT